MKNVVRHKFAAVVAVKWASLASTMFMLSSCGWLFGPEGVWPPKPDPYLVVEEREGLEYPATVRATALNEQYIVPELPVRQVLPERFELPRLTPLQSVSQRGSVRIQTLGDEQWILVNSSPALVWPQLKTFFLSNGVPLAVENGSAGLMETDWLLMGESMSAGLSLPPKKAESDASTNNIPQQKARFRVQLKAGVQKDTAELYVERIAAANGSEDDATDLMVRQIAEYLANSPGEQSYSLLAQGITSASKVQLMMPEDAEPYIDLQLTYDRGWASILLALKKASYQVRDLDRSAGTILARRLSREELRAAAKRAEKKEGFWGRLFLDDEELASSPDDYRFVITTATNGLEIRVERVSGEALDHAEKAFLLKQLQGLIS